MNILITGGAGFIGSNFVHYWRKKHPGDQVTIFDKLTYAGNLNNLSSLTEGIDYKFVQADICNGQRLKEVIVEYNIDTIVNFAAETHVDRSISGPGEFINTNIIGTHTLLEVIREYPKVRYHHISTDEVYGSLPLDQPDTKFTEQTPYSPRSPYSASKAASDHLVRSYINTYGIKATISNCSNNYGPYCHLEKLIPLTITRALSSKKIPVYGMGNQVRDWIYVEDHCKGVDLILHKGKLGETYLLGGNGERTNIWIIEKILGILDRPKSLIQHVTDRKGHDERYAIDFKKAQTELGFYPEKEIDEWLSLTVSWYVDNGKWWKEQEEKAHEIAERYLNPGP